MAKKSTSSKKSAAKKTAAKKSSQSKEQQDSKPVQILSSRSHIPKPKVELEEEVLKEMYHEMLLIRRFEERCAQQYQLQNIRGFCHLYIGQEATAVGALRALRKDDWIFQTYRDHAHALLRGCSPRSVMAELFAKETGCAKGKGGSMHMFNVPEHFMGGNGIVGGHVPLATGAAFASAYNKSKQVAVCFIGDSVVNQGVFHESLNMASLWNLPLIIVCENNKYGMGTAVHRASAVDDLYVRTPGAYNIRGVQADGMDALDMYYVMSKAAERAREHGRPTFIEAITYRYRGHSMSDPATAYRTKDEVSEWQRKDPMTRLEEQYPDLFTEKWIKEQEEEVKEIVKDAIEFADQSDFPDPEELYKDVYAEYPGYPQPDEPFQGTVKITRK